MSGQEIISFRNILLIGRFDDDSAADGPRRKLSKALDEHELGTSGSGCSARVSWVKEAARGRKGTVSADNYVVAHDGRIKYDRNLQLCIM